MVHYLIKKGEIIMLKRIFKISITIAISIISAFAFIIAISMMIDAFKNAKEIENLYFCDYEDYKGNSFMEGVISKDIDELQTTLLTAESIDGLDNITRIRINEIVKELNDFREGYRMSSLFTENQVERFELCNSYLSNEITESVFKEQIIDSSINKLEEEFNKEKEYIRNNMGYSDEDIQKAQNIFKDIFSVQATIKDTNKLNKMNVLLNEIGSLSATI